MYLRQPEIHGRKKEMSSLVHLKVIQLTEEGLKNCCNVDGHSCQCSLPDKRKFCHGKLTGVTPSCIVIAKLEGSSLKKKTFKHFFGVLLMAV